MKTKTNSNFVGDEENEILEGDKNFVVINPKKKPKSRKYKYIFKITLVIIGINLYAFLICYFYSKFKNLSDSLECIDEKENNLYEYFKYPQISIIVQIYKKNKLSLNEIELFIENIKDQALKDIEIIFLFEEINENLYKKLNNLISNDDRFIISNEYDLTQSKLWNIYQTIIKSKGKFINLLDISDRLNTYSLDNAINKTHGQKGNVFEYQDLYNKTNIIIKRKTLLDVFDSIELSKYKNITEIINIVQTMPEPNLNYLNFVLSTDDKFVPLTYVSLLSLLDTKNINSFYSIYILLSNDVTEKSKNIMLSLYEQYDYFDLSFIYFEERYFNAYTNKRFSKTTYYRYSSAEILNHLNKVIYLDSDIIAYRDLYNLYNLNLNDKLMLGLYNGETVINGKVHIYFNTGILIMNLKKMREIQFEKKFIEGLNNFKVNFFTAKAPDQYLLRNLFGDLCDYFPVEFHTKLHEDILDAMTEITYSKRKVYNDYQIGYFQNYPYIRHYYRTPKPISKKYNRGFKDDWWYFARKSKYYKWILKESEKM